jgi:regulator of replication initiation timing
MSTQPTPENYNPDTLEAVEQQQVNLKLELERVHKDVSRLRGWIQLLVSGLVLATLISIIISSWLTYRLLVQQEIARLEAAEAATTQEEMLKRVEQLEQQLQSFTGQFPGQLADLTDKNRVTQQELQRLRERLNQLEAQQRDTQPSASSSEPAVEKPIQPNSNLQGGNGEQ